MSRRTKPGYLRALPSIDRLLRTDEAEALSEVLGTQRLTAMARSVNEELRQEFQSQVMPELNVDETRLKEKMLARAVKKLQEVSERDKLAGIRRVINATGVILHTNLGRAPLSDAARTAASEAGGYCTLEYDTTSGHRGRRGSQAENLLVQLTGAEEALVVNNCAAAALLILKVLAEGGETIVSRGELVEIGGDFRVPDVMANSGTRMIEVGTTNRTRLSDYQRALTKETRLIMRVHPSNYRIVGFTSTPTLRELAEFGHNFDLPLYADAGSGAVVDLSEYGLTDEPVIRKCIEEGADVVSFSGDKLLGSTQAGLIVGRRAIVSRLRKHSLFRALRADKLCLAALEATLDAHLRGAAFQEVPALRMLAAPETDIEARAMHFLDQLVESQNESGLQVELMRGQSAIGGGSGPSTHPPTTLIGLKHSALSANVIEEFLRSSNPPIIARVSEGRVVVDLRTVAETDEPELLQAVLALKSIGDLPLR